jgi:F-type H+-transporting ATPase subunit delta
MLNPRLAGRYAKSIIDLAVERNQLEVVHDDMQYLGSVMKQSREFTNLLQSPVVSAEKKTQVFDAIAKGKISDLTIAFAHLLISKNREFYLPEIAKAYVDQYNEIKGIHKVKLTTAVEVTEEVKNSIISKIKADTAIDNIEMETAVKPELIGGFVLEFNNNLVDASIVRDLRDVKTQFDQNIYVQQIR